MYLLDLVYPEAEELLEIEKGEMATSVYGLPVYFRVRGADDADAFHDGAAHAIQISIRYLDIGTDPIVLAYSTDASTETTQTIVTKGNTGKWKWKHKTITSNARFDHSVYLNFDYADFALTCDSELLLSNVTLRETALNTEAVWKAAEERVTATAGEAAIDTTLFSGWTVSETYLARDTGTDNTSAGLAPDDYPFYAGATYANRATAPFRVTPAGALVATSATITGSITATSGTIGGFEIGTDYLRDAANSFGLASTVTGSDDVRFWAGASFASRATAPFRATEAGAVTATNITITGGAIDGAVINNLSITAGKIGNLEITAAQIANSTITGAKIDTGTITGGNIASGTITAGNMADLTITAGKIANLTITAAQVNNYTLKLGNLTQEVVNALSQMDARNQLYNGGFEDGSTFWNSGTVQTNSANAHSGNKYLEMTSDGSSSVQVDETGATRYFQIIASQTIRFSAWAYRASGDRNIWCVVETFDKDYASIAYHISPNVSAATTWTQTSVEFVAESNAKYARVYLEIQNGTTTTTARFDDVTLFILVPGGDIVARTITADRIVAGAITTNEIAAGTITASNIAAGTITASNIASGTITATQLSATAIDSMTITGATIRTASSGARSEMNASNLFGLGFGGIGGYDGSTVQWYAKASDGKIYFAGGGGTLSSSGLLYAVDTGSAGVKVVEWLDGSNSAYMLSAYKNTGPNEYRGRIDVNADAVSGYDSDLRIIASSSATAGDQSYIALVAYKSVTGAGFFITSSTTQKVEVLGDLLWYDDNTYDIGANGATRPKNLYLSGTIFTDNSSFMHRSTAGFTNGSGANTGTLTNAPRAGNPTKWIGIDDNGTTRYIPAW